MCIQAIAKALTGDIGGAFKAEANAWGIGGASANAGFCGAKGASARGSYCESRHSRGWESGSKSHGSKCESGYGYGREDATFSKTTTQTRVGPDGSVTRKTTEISHAGAGSAGYGNYGYNQHSGYRQFGQSGCAQYASSGFGERGFSHSTERSGAWNNGAEYSASGAAGGSFAAASVKIGPAFGLGNILGLFGLGAPNAQAA
jgi:hypothetical protein